MKRFFILFMLILGLLSGLTACGTPKAGDPCKIPGHAAKDAEGHDLFCGNNSEGKRVWIQTN